MIDTKALRSRVLDLAIRGKLTEQLPSDGTAEELYQQIQAEKQALIKEGKIKKEKPLPEISADEIPFEIPSNWKYVTLSSITTDKTLNDGDWVLSTDMVSNGDVKLIQLGSIGECNYVEKGFKYLTYKHFQELKGKQIYPGYLLINRMVGEKLLDCIIPPIEGVLMTAVDVCWIAPKEEWYNIEYLMYMLASATIQKRVKELGYGTTRFRISKLNLINIYFPLPPLAEQKRIVERVEEIFRLLDTIDEAQEKYSADAESLRAKLITAGIQGKLTEQLPSDGTAEELYQQIQEEKKKLIKEGKLKKEKPLPAISDEEIPFEIPGNWKWVRFSEVYKLSNGIASRGSKGGIERPVLRLADIKDNCLNIDNIRGILLTDNEYNTHIIRKNDLVIIRVNGSKERVAMSFPYEYDTDISYCDHLFCARKKTDLVCSEYFAIAINTKAIREQIVPMIKTTAGQNTISQGSLNSILLPLPPLAEQKRIAEVLERVLGALSLQ